jgi:hypothetical protein
MPKERVDPIDCPDPDCPVVGDTPGSLVHFYSVLRSIAFNQTCKTLSSLATPGSGVYEQVAQIAIMIGQTFLGLIFLSFDVT